MKIPISCEFISVFFLQIQIVWVSAKIYTPVTSETAINRKDQENNKKSVNIGILFSAFLKIIGTIHPQKKEKRKRKNSNNQLSLHLFLVKITL